MFYVALPLLTSVAILVVGAMIREAANPYFVPSIKAVTPFCLIMAGWSGWFIYGRPQMHRRLQREIAALDAIENDD